MIIKLSYFSRLTFFNRSRFSSSFSQVRKIHYFFIYFETRYFYGKVEASALGMFLRPKQEISGSPGLQQKLVFFERG